MSANPANQRIRRPASILMTADTVGGVWTFSIELARALEPHGVHVNLATMGGWLAPDQIAQARAISNLEVFESRFRLEWMDCAWADVNRAGDWLLGLEQRLAPDIVHLNGYCHGNLRWKSPVIMTGHSCVLSWWEAVKGAPAPPEWDEYRSRVRAGLQSATLVTAPTQAMLETLDRHYGPLPNAIVIPNARDAREFRVGPKEPFIMAAGRLWDEAKNVAGLDAISAGLKWPVCIAGETKHPNGEDFQRKNSRLLGRLSQASMADHLARAAIYAHPARYEPFGLSVLEAALSGCALVLGDIPSLRENWNGAAVFVEPADTGALKQALRTLIDDAELRSSLGARAKARAQLFTPARLADGYLSAYDSVRPARQVRTCA